MEAAHVKMVEEVQVSQRGGVMEIEGSGMDAEGSDITRG